MYDDVRQLSDVAPLTLRHLVPSNLRNASYGPVKFPLGFLERVTAKLEVRGWRVAVDGSTKADFFFPSSDWANQARSGPAMLDHAYGRAFSLAHVPRRLDRLRIVATLREQLSEDDHLLVVTRNQREAKSVSRRLAKILDRSVTYGNEQRIEYPWTHVDGIGTLGGRHLGFHFVVFWDAATVLNKTSIVHLSHMTESIRIGFLTRDERWLNPWDRALIEGMFGPVIFRPATEHEALTIISVSWLTVPSYFECRTYGPLERKRNYIWRNEARNRAIAAAALALASGDRREASKYCLDTALDWLVGGELGQIPICAVRPSVVVVVENLVHARELATLLPGWNLQSLHNLDPEAPLITGNTIVTLPLAAMITLASAVVVFAAGCGQAWFDDYGAACIGATGDRMLILDVADDFDPQAIEEVRCRKADYIRRGWPTDRHDTGTRGG